MGPLEAREYMTSLVDDHERAKSEATMERSKRPEKVNGLAA